jgi:hypothetical protein
LLRVCKDFPAIFFPGKNPHRHREALMATELEVELQFTDRALAEEVRRRLAEHGIAVRPGFAPRVGVPVIIFGAVIALAELVHLAEYIRQSHQCRQVFDCRERLEITTDCAVKDGTMVFILPDGRVEVRGVPPVFDLRPVVEAAASGSGVAAVRRAAEAQGAHVVAG